MDGHHRPPPPPPPPPPPHGANPKNAHSGLPPGNYDIFIVPPHSSGSGFIYLPSLQPHRNSFLAGLACGLLSVAMWNAVAPMLKQWLNTVASGSATSILVVIGVGIAGWAWGKTQMEYGSRPWSRDAGGGADGRPNDAKGTQGEWSTPPPQANGYTRPTPSPGASAGWEKAREETKKREEERRKQEELRRKREEAEKQARAAAEKEKWEKMRAREKEVREREARERIVRERLAREKDAREAEARLRAERNGRPGVGRDRVFGVGERTDPYAGTSHKSGASNPPSPTKRYERPTAQSCVDSQEDIHSFRPYDKPRRATHMSSHSSVYSESYAPSQSTARTSPPPSHRGPYTTKDPDKIVIKAVYLFNEMFPKPVAQLITGTGSVTNGLILRITTEGLFIDDDIRSVPQREWDVKAWTMKLVEVWCPHLMAKATNPSAPKTLKKDPVQRFLNGSGSGNSGTAAKLSSDELDLVLEHLLRLCKSSNGSVPFSQTGDRGGLHILRASVRDAEGKKYVFVLGEEEGWKVAVGLQRLRRGTQVRALGVSSLQAAETTRLLTSLGWA